jgi:4-hydroxy-4-methyl-2-oxoglutarate aldolase
VTALDSSLLDELRSFSTPSVANGIETFDVRPRTEGYMNAGVRCMFPELGPLVAFAATATIRASEPGESADRALWAHVSSQSAPRVVVVQDLDPEPGTGSMWGEVNSNIFQAFGAIGVLTNGCVRDLDEMRDLGFHAFAGSVCVSHAYVHVCDVGGTVTVGGISIAPGDLLHGDQHGVISIPHEIAAELPAAIHKLEEAERGIIAMFRGPDFSVEKFAGDVDH